MKRKALAVAAVFVVAFALGSSPATAAVFVSVDVPFSFFVNAKELPAGRYEIRPQGEGNTALLVQSASGGGTAVAPILERLADAGAKQSKVVFDKVEGKYYLSEVHIPAMDGFLVGIAKGKETHEVITGKP